MLVQYSFNILSNLHLKLKFIHKFNLSIYFYLVTKISRNEVCYKLICKSWEFFFLRMFRSFLKHSIFSNELHLQLLLNIYSYNVFWDLQCHETCSPDIRYCFFHKYPHQIYNKFLHKNFNSNFALYNSNAFCFLQISIKFLWVLDNQDEELKFLFVIFFQVPDLMYCLKLFRLLLNFIDFL